MILLIEDDVNVAFFAERALSQGGYEVQTADAIDPALELLASSSFELIICDLGLPNGHGLATLSRIRSAAPTIPLVVHTGREKTPEGTQALLRHSDAVVYKTLHPDPPLLAVVTKLIVHDLHERIIDLQAQLELSRQKKPHVLARLMPYLRGIAEICGTFLRSIARKD